MRKPLPPNPAACSLTDPKRRKSHPAADPEQMLLRLLWSSKYARPNAEEELSKAGMLKTLPNTLPVSLEMHTASSSPDSSVKLDVDPILPMFPGQLKNCVSEIHEAIKLWSSC